MRKHLTAKKILLTIGLLFLLMQFAVIDKTVKSADPGKDFLLLNATNTELGAIIKNSCYDCHSNEVKYPWYTNVAPVSWWIKHHINEGSEHLNFSEWGTYSGKRKDHKLEECVEMLEENEMPLSSYVMIHSNAELSADQKQKLSNYFNSLRTGESEEE